MKISHFAFCAIYSLLYCIFLNISAWKELVSLIEIKSIKDIEIFVVTFAIYGLVFFSFFSIVFQKYTTKVLAIILLIAGTICAYFINTYHVIINKEMIENSLATDVNEMRDLLSWQMLLYFALVVSTSYAIIKVRITYCKPLRFTLIKLATIFAPILCGLLILWASYAKISVFFRVHKHFQDNLTPVNFLTALLDVYRKNPNAVSEPAVEPKKLPDITNKLNSKNQIVVLVVGETARRKNFSIYGYERQTNPLLAKQTKLKIIQNMSSCGTSTKISVPCIFKSSEEYESFITFLQRIGINTKWYDNNYGGCYGMCEREKTFYVDHKKCDGSCPDGEMLAEFGKDLSKAKSGKWLFVLHENGSHGPLYYKRYPKEYGIFKPECQTNVVNRCKMEELINAYDNTILYTDYVLNEIIEKLKKTKQDAIMIYASDHGESLGEHGFFLHGFPYNIAPKEQKEIPFLIWSSRDIKIKPKDGYHHKNILHTVFGALGVENSVYQKDMDVVER